MKISDVRVWPLKKDHPSVKANGDFVVDDTFKIKFTLFKGEKGLFVGLPGKKGTTVGTDGKFPWYPDVSFANDEDHSKSNELQKLAVAVYNQATGNSMSQDEAPGPTNQVVDDGLPF